MIVFGKRKPEAGRFRGGPASVSSSAIPWSNDAPIRSGTTHVARCHFKQEARLLP